MGNIPSTLALLYNAVSNLRKTYLALQTRLALSPGLPVPNPTPSFWTFPPSHVSSDPNPFPQSADIVIIGSGITGVSVLYNLLKQNPDLRVLMLEARDVCSGATGRNGGHINPPLYHDYDTLQDRFGDDVAKTIIRFRLSHIQEMKHITTQEDILKESQFRQLEHVDVFLDHDAFIAAKAKLAKWEKAMPHEAAGFGYLERNEAIDKYHLGNQTVGCIYNPGGAIHPYRFVTNLLGKLIDRHSNFYIATHTPCTYIHPPSSTSRIYAVHTPRGIISTPHIVHATNGWCSHLLPPLRQKIISARGAMSAQRPGRSLHPSTLSGWRSFVFFRAGAGYDYLTQLPTGEHELMFGGGWAQSTNSDGLPELGIADDAETSFGAQAHLAGALPLYFGLKNWGQEASPSAPSGDGGEQVVWDEGRTKAHWSGILGISVDMLPWVGRLPPKLTERAQPISDSHTSLSSSGTEKRAGLRTAAPGEWLAAGYSGEGMVHAWMSGKALACMILDQETELEGWFPDVLRVTEKRWKDANVDDLLARIM